MAKRANAPSIREEIFAALSDGPVSRSTLDLWICAGRGEGKEAKLTEALDSLVEAGILARQGDFYSRR